MAENVTLAPVASFTNDSSAVATVNANNALIETAFSDCLSLSGSQPNRMQSNLDMNSFQVLNLPAPATINSPARLIDVVSNPTLVITGTGATYSNAASQATVGLGTGSAAATWSLDVNNALAYGLSTSGTASANATALTSATTTGPSFLPIGNYTTNLSELFLGSTWGPGRWTDGSSNQRAPWHYSITSAPTYTGSGYEGGDNATVFNGDFSHVPFATQMWIQGATTAGSPTSVYLNAPPNQIPHYTNYYTSSGAQSLSTAIARTGQFVYGNDAFHAGQGDLTTYSYSMFAAGPILPSSTTFLQNQAVNAFSGQLTAGFTGAFLSVGQQILYDGGIYDVAGQGWNITSNRTITTGAQNAWWNAYRSQSIGSGFVDTGYQAIGPHKIGLDLSFATLPGSGNWQSAAITLTANQRIYFNATATDASNLSRFPVTAGSIYMDYNGSNIEFTAGLTSTGLIKSSNATGGIGYSTGAGGTVTQATNKTTGVTLNKVTGQITMNGAALANSTTPTTGLATFVVTNSTVAVTDTVTANISGGTVALYNCYVTNIAAGSFWITVQNASGGSLSEALVINFTVHKGAAS